MHLADADTQSNSQKRSRSDSSQYSWYTLPGLLD